MVLRLTRRFLPALSLIALGLYLSVQVVVVSRAAMTNLTENSEAAFKNSFENAIGSIDYSLWSRARIEAYKASWALRSKPPLAVLRIRRLRIIAPVFNGTDDLTLSSGVGRIPGTALPGQAGNIGLAGHRDSFFRGLMNVAVGDAIELVTPQETGFYVVDKIFITKPHDLSPLEATPTPALTLVTCYPFYYIGSAPQRYIVRALKQPARPQD
jgi:sortase A